MSSRTTSLVEGGILSGVTVMLTLFGIYIPIFYIFIKLVQALPLLILVVRHGVKIGIIAAFVTAILIAIIVNPLNGLVFLVGLAPVAIVVGWSIRERKAVSGLIFGAVAALLSKLAVIGIAFWLVNIDIIGQLVASIQESIPLAIEMYKTIGMDEASRNALSQMSSELIPTFILVIPALFIGQAFMEAYVNFWLARVVLRRLGHPIDDFPSVKYWDLPRAFLYGWVLSFASWKGGAYFFGTQALTYKFGLNCFVFFSGALFVQGLAVLNFFLTKHSVSKILRILIMILTLSIPMINFMVIYGGGIDMFANFRRLQRRQQ